MLFIVGTEARRHPGHFPWTDLIQTVVVAVILLAAVLAFVMLRTDLLSDSTQSEVVSAAAQEVQQIRPAAERILADEVAPALQETSPPPEEAVNGIGNSVNEIDPNWNELGQLYDENGNGPYASKTIVVDALDPQTLYIVVNPGPSHYLVWKSTDGGDTLQFFKEVFSWKSKGQIFEEEMLPEGRNTRLSDEAGGGWDTFQEWFHYEGWKTAFPDAETLNFGMNWNGIAIDKGITFAIAQNFSGTEHSALLLSEKEPLAKVTLPPMLNYEPVGVALVVSDEEITLYVTALGSKRLWRTVVELP